MAYSMFDDYPSDAPKWELASQAEADGFLDGGSGADNVLQALENGSPDGAYEWAIASVPDNSEAANYAEYEADYRKGYRRAFYGSMQRAGATRPRALQKKT